MMSRHVALGGSGAHQRSLAHVGSLAYPDRPRLRSTVIWDHALQPQPRGSFGEDQAVARYLGRMSMGDFTAS
jgi:hypothetical protein